MNGLDCFVKRLIYIIVLSVWGALSLLAQTSETIVVGEVYDATTGEPLPNVNVYLQGTQIGTTTNAEGLFLLRGMLERKRTMVVSAVGYKTERFTVEPGQQAGVDIALKEKVGSIEEVLVLPGDNPALALMAEVRRHRHENERALSAAVDKTTALYVSDIDSRHLRRTLWKSLQSGMLTDADSTYLLPLYRRQEYDGVVEEQAAMLTVTDYQTILGQLQPCCEFYKNNVQVLSASLVSPLSASGGTYYNYYLADSLHVNGEKHYLIHFRTKNPFYATWNGEMEIDSATYALRRLEASVPTQVNINYLRQLTVRQQYGIDNRLLYEQMSILLDFAIKADTSHIFPTLLLTREVRQPEDMALTVNELSVSDSAFVAAIDTLNNSPLFRFAKFCAYVIQTGYLPTSRYVEVGRLTETLKYSQQEGLRIGVPLRTTEALSKDVSLEAFVAYGIGDRAFKGAGMLHVNIPSTRRHQMHLRYGDEYVYSDVDEFSQLLRENSTWSTQMSLLTNWLQGAVYNKAHYYNTAVRRQEGRVLFEDEWNDYLETRAYVKVGRMGYGQPTRVYGSQPSFLYTTLGGSARISFGERKLDLYFHRRHIYNNKPVVYVGAEVGSYQTVDMSSYRMYGNVNMLVRQYVDLGQAGTLRYTVQGGVVLGRVPYTLLHIMPGNQTYTFDEDRFTLMNNYQYAADWYVTLQSNWNGGGVLFNLIPGVRYLRLRELLELKVAYGGIYGNHQSVLAYPENTFSTLRIPYVEVGVGIGNILRIGELYSVWRVTHISDPTAPYWALRFRLKLGL